MNGLDPSTLDKKGGGSSNGVHPRSQEFSSRTALYRTDAQFNILHEWSYIPWVDSLFVGTYGGNQNWAHTYIVTDSSLVLSYNTLLMECLTEAPYTCRELSNPILQESTWFDDPQSLMSNIVPVYPACDSTFLLRLAVDTISQEMSAYCIDPTSFTVDTFTLQYGCEDFRSSQLMHGRSLVVASLDMRYRKPPTCEIDLQLDADGSSVAAVQGDYRQTVICPSSRHRLIDDDALLRSNGGRVAYIDIVYPPGDCMVFNVDEISRYRVVDRSDRLRLYVDDKTDYTAAIRVLDAIRVSWCDDWLAEEVQIEITVTLTSGQSVTRVSTFDLTNATARPSPLYDEVDCVEGAIDTVVLVDPPIVVNSTDVMSDDQQVIFPCYAGVINYTITDENGCQYMDSLSVNPYRPAIANVFSPNGDRNNDSFNQCLAADCTFSIYDSWGNRVYDGGHTTPWDGLMYRTAVSPGMYFWQLQTSMRSSHGTVLLIR